MMKFNLDKYCSSKIDTMKHIYHVGLKEYKELEVTNEINQKISATFRLTIGIASCINYLQDKTNKIIYQNKKLITFNKNSRKPKIDKIILDKLDKIENNIQYIKQHENRLLNQLELLLEKKNKPQEDKYHSLLNRIEQIAVKIEEQSRIELVQLADSTRITLDRYSQDMNLVQKQFSLIKNLLAPDTILD